MVSQQTERRPAALPPGQHRARGFPRFGTHLHRPPPQIPADPGIEIQGPAVARPITVAVTSLSQLPRRELTADFHCVSGWSATDLRWEGVAFGVFYRRVIEPALEPGTPVTHLVFRGLDGYRSVVQIDDALSDDVLIADGLDGQPLHPDHGAPVRLVSPDQYGYISTKHLCRVEVHTREPRLPDPAAVRIGRFTLRTPLIRTHPRARVWEEERHPHLPARALRPLYRSLIPLIRYLSERGAVSR